MKSCFSKYKIIITAIFVVGQFLFFGNLYGQDETAKAGIALSFYEKDSVKQINVLVKTVDSSGKETPAKEVETHIYIKKSFGLLPLEGDNLTTDESGMASVDFPVDIPGDSLGNVIVVAKVEDNDELGNLEDIKTVKWGIPKFNEYVFRRRALWATGANAPIPLVITVTSMVIGVWGVIFYIVKQLFKIKQSEIYEIKNQK